VPPSPTAGVPTPDRESVPIDTDGGHQWTWLMAYTRNMNVGNSARSHVQPAICFDIYYQNGRGLQTKQLELYSNVCSIDYSILRRG
jgi:hypothetical protein